jgi:hypothetical protein
MNCSVCQTIVQVHPCARCFTPVCSAHAGFAYRDEYQYDKESWVCFTSCRGLALVPYVPDFQQGIEYDYFQSLIASTAHLAPFEEQMKRSRA